MKKYPKVELQKLALKLLINSRFINSNYKLYFCNKLSNISSKSTCISSYRKYCLFTYAGKVITNKFKLGRHAVRYFAGLGLLCGLRKSSF
jgi:ribosomal protein S14